MQNWLKITIIVSSTIGGTICSLITWCCCNHCRICNFNNSEWSESSCSY